MKSPQEIIKRPLLTEKSTQLRETGGHDFTHGEDDTYAQKVVFEVDKGANKIEIREAVQRLFNVKVTDVHTQVCLLYTSPSPRDATLSRMPSSA